MERIEIKPISVNEVWKGRRFKTPAYKRYERCVSYLLDRSMEIPDGKLWIRMRAAFSSSGSDLDNVIKPFLDILQKKYGFNDNRIYRIEIEKTLVNKGEEHIEFEILEYID